MQHTIANSRKQSISVIIADDHSLVADMLAEMLRASGDFEVTTLSSFAEVRQISGKCNLLLLDVNMPGMNGISSVIEIIDADLSRAVVLFSGNTTTEFVRQALAAGARGFLPKTISIRTLVNALRLIAAGEVFVPSSFLQQGMVSDADSRESSTLSERELTVLRSVSAGMKNKEIAHLLGLSEVTVKMHVRSICAKLTAKNRAHACIVGKERGLI